MSNPKSSRTPDLIDLHVYGGAACVCVGLAMLATWAGPVALGVILMTLGLRRP